MDENETLVGELRRYLRSAQQPCIYPESEQVQSLKRDLLLATRVGQQLLMQLRKVERERDEQNMEISKLREQNREIQRENQRLAAEHGVLTDSLNEQEQQVAQLIEQLSGAQLQADKLARATASARALEREVQLLEQAHLELTEKGLTQKLTDSVDQELKELRRDLEFDIPSLTMATSYVTDISQLEPVGPSFMPKVSTTVSTFEPHVEIVSSDDLLHSTPRKSPLRPKLRHAHSHESVLSLIPTFDATHDMAPKIAAPSPDLPRVDAPEVKATAEVSVKTKSAARDKLSAVRRVEVRKPERRWAFTPFRLA